MVKQLFRWPVKSMGGEALDALDLDTSGVVGDRAYALWQRGDRRLTARATPRLLAWQARYAGDNGDGPLLTAPDGTEWTWGAEGLVEALDADLDRRVALSYDPDGHRDVEGTVLVTLESTRRRLEEELGRPVDIRRFRTNLHLDVDAEPFAELAWEGRTLRAGGAELLVDHLCDRCAITTRDPDAPHEAWGDLLRQINKRHDTYFGVRAKVAGPARVRVGDPVALG
jgi:uncharacterized protein YcbX